MDTLEEKKGENILLLDIRGLAPFADFFIICSGTSDRMLQALAEASMETVHKDYRLPARIEGKPQDGWILVDFGDVILHIFSPDKREYYQLEELWSQGKIVLHIQ
ncbi:MAG: ribosome silencing factor [Anaerolineaceae bacterium]